MKKLLPSLAGFTLLLPFVLPSTAVSADDPGVNRLLASQCAQCHGTDGYSQNDLEGIAGEEAKDMYEDLTDMKGEDQPENIMDHQALGYTDDQIRRIASYYATLPEDQESREGESSSGSATFTASTSVEIEEQGEKEEQQGEERDEEDEEHEEDEEDEEDEEGDH